MTRVAMVSPYALDVPGGVQDQVLGLAERLREKTFEVEVVGPTTSDPSFGRVSRWRANGSVAPISLDPTGWRTIRRALAGFDVVHIHEPFMPLVSWAALSVPAPRKVLTFHADPSNTVRTLYRLVRPNRAFGSTTALVAVSATAASAIAGGRRPVHIIPNGVRAIAGSPVRRAKQVAFLGRDEPRKGLEVLLAAWPAVRSQHPDAQLVVMGTERPPHDGVTYLGRVDEDVKDLELGRSAVFCAPNLGGESFGITVVEAMSAGCAVVASDLPAFRDVLGESGGWFPPGDSDVLARQLINRLDDPDGCRSMGERALTRSALYRWDRVTDAYIDLYQSDSAN